MSRSTRMGAAAAAALLLLAAPGAAQSLAERVASAAADGPVRLSYPARPGVCGYGDAIMMRDPERGEKGSVSIFQGSWRDRDHWEDLCVAGPVRVELRARDGRVLDLRTRVGEPYPAGDGADLGTVDPQEAADYLLGLAEGLPPEAGKDAMVAAILARDAEVRPRLLRLALRDGVPVETRRHAVFWAGQEGAPVDDLRRVYDGGVPEEVREHVLFAYSQHPDPAAARELLRVARAGEEPGGLREKAVFWLGQAAGRAVTRDLGEIVDDDDVDAGVREQAVFALSQRPRDEGVPALLRIARESPDPRLRRRAIFWLGQSGDPRALALFEELLGVR